MIAKLTGKVSVINNHDGSIILELSSGVAYEVSVGAPFCNKCSLNAEVSIFTDVIVREDSHSMFGFVSYDELIWFRSLLKVSGIGPKLGRAILDVASPEQISLAILSKKPELLGKISGLGPKTLERLILDLKNEPKKNAGILATVIMAGGRKPVDQVQNSQIIERSDAISALVNLGFAQAESTEAVMSIEGDYSIGDIIQRALKKLQK